LLVAPNNPDAVAGALRRVLVDGAMANRLRQAGRARARRFSWRVIGEEIEDVYLQAAGRGPCL